MTLWHQTGDAPCRASFEGGMWWLDLEIGTWPVEAGQSVSIEATVSDEGERVRPAISYQAIWTHNKGPNSHWHARLGPFKVGSNVEYSLEGSSADGKALHATFSMRIGPKLLLAILWHQHQPMYLDYVSSVAKNSFMLPWVRLHCIRDYYSVAALLTHHPNVHLTINLTPVLLHQIEAYVDGACTDRALDLTLTPTSELTAGDLEYIATQFFDADWHHEIYPHARYKELLEKRGHRRPLNDADITGCECGSTSRGSDRSFNLAKFCSRMEPLHRCVDS